MSVLNDTRAELKAALEEAEINAFDHVPNLLHPPCSVISPATTYLSSGDGTPFGYYNVRYAILNIVPSGPNPIEVAALNDLVEGVLVALDGLFEIEEVGTFYQLQVSGTNFLSAEIIVRTQISFKE